MLLISGCAWVSFAAESQQPDATAGLFASSARCIACHSNLETTSGEDVSIGHAWRASMMANSARDPYWHAAVRREVLDHPEAQVAIEDKCSTCHMPMSRVEAAAAGDTGKVFANLAAMRMPGGELAADGVSCTVCHQIDSDNFGSEASFTGGFSIDTTSADERVLYGPHDVDHGRRRLMESASGFVPAASDHLKESELCATCHTLYTHALDDQGAEVGELAEQAPYLEWLASDFRQTHSCQDCHMPELGADTPISSVLGTPRPAFSQHAFRGGNTFMLSVLNKYRGELGVKAMPNEFALTVRRTRDFLQTQTATLAIDAPRRRGGELEFRITIENLAGHKLPTAYPSRRVWLHVTVSDAAGKRLFESGAAAPDGSIAGNDNDIDPATFEPHYEEITSGDQVQIYEPILVDWRGRVTTGLLFAVVYIKDNRLLPRGFDKRTADDDIAVAGDALEDVDFRAGGDRLVYRIPIVHEGELRVRAELLYQSIGFRWADNLRGYSSEETERFVRYYDETIENQAVVLARDETVLTP